MEQLIQFHRQKLQQENERLQETVELLQKEIGQAKDDVQIYKKELDLAKSLIAQFNFEKEDSSHKCNVLSEQNLVRHNSNQNSAFSSYEKRTDPIANYEQHSENNQSNASIRSNNFFQAMNLNIPANIQPETELEKLLMLKLTVCQDELRKEHERWKTEKGKVIEYQKRLQLNYLQVLHKNRLLESEVQQLTGELAEQDFHLLEESIRSSPTFSS